MTMTSPETPALIGIDNDDRPAAAIPIPSINNGALYHWPLSRQQE